MKLNILYTGLPLSGRKETLKHLLSLRSAADYLQLSTTGMDFSFLVNNQRYDLFLFSEKDRPEVKFRNNILKWDAPNADREREFLKRVHGMVFVVDSLMSRIDDSEWFVEETKSNLNSLGRTCSDIPVVFQLNKRDKRNIASIDTIQKRLRWEVCSYVETVAVHGVGVSDVLVSLMRLIKQSHDS